MHPTADGIIAGFARSQHGLVTRRQLLEAGVRDSLLYRRVRQGFLHRIHQGVYQAGPVAMPLARPMAAYLACGPDSAISHESASALVGLGPGEPSSAPVHVSIAERDVRPRAGLRTHRVQDLSAGDIMWVEGIPVTKPARTIVDLAASADRRRLEQMTARAEREGKASRESVLREAERCPRRPGVGTLISLLISQEELALTESEAEERLLKIVRDAELDEPETNVYVEGFKVDVFWRAQGLIIEVDGFQYHSTRVSYENDRRRDAILTGAGYLVVRLTWHQITMKRDPTLVTIVRALQQAEARRGGGRDLGRDPASPRVGPEGASRRSGRYGRSALGESSRSGRPRPGAFVAAKVSHRAVGRLVVVRNAASVHLHT